MCETKFYKDKVYLPRQMREKLGLVEGDVLHIEVVERGVAKLIVLQRCGASKRLVEALDNPPDLGSVKGKLTREKIYEDII